jgi:hypothetical protein
MRLVLACLALVAMLTPPALASPRPFELRDGQVVIMVTIKGKQLPALLDTGATRSLIERDLAREFGIRSHKLRGGGGTTGAAGGLIPFGMTEQDVAIDFGAGPASRRIGTYEAGHSFAADGVRLLIGMDFLSRLVVSLDFERMTIDFQRSSGFKPPPGEPLKLDQNGWYRPTLRTMLGDVQAELLIDTAASGAMHLDSTFVAKWPALSALPASRRRVSGVDGVREYDAIALPNVSFAGQTFENVRATSGSLAPMRAADDMDGVMGVDLLRRFNLVIDFGYNRVWMTPIAAASVIDP